MNEETNPTGMHQIPLSGEVAYYSALLEAQLDAPRVIKADEKHYDNYMYASETTYQRLLVPILLEHGLVYELAGVSPPDDVELSTRGGGIQWMSTLEVAFRVTHAASGHSEVYRIIGRRTNDKDKGVQHAIASAGKTFLQRLLNVSDAEDAPTNPVDGSTASNRRKGKEPKKDTPPPPKAEGTKLSNGERLQMAKDEVKALVRENHYRSYHLEALGQMVPDLPDLVEEWGLQDFELVQKVLTLDRTQPERAMDALSEKYPSDPDRTEKLHDLQKKLIEQGKAMTSEEQILVAGAIAANWNDAVEYWIDKLHTRLSGQQELDT